MRKSYDMNRFCKVNGKFIPTSEYSTWQHMKQRCLNPNSDNYQHYGGRGIRICERWVDSFDNFLEDIGKRPTNVHSIDRLNVDGDYCPENCRWATRQEQAANRTISTKVDFRGETRDIQSWCYDLGLNYNTTWHHLNNGLTLSESTALQKKPKFSAAATQEELINLYITQDKTRPELANILNVSESTISKWLRKFGITKYKTNREQAKKLQLSLDVL